MPGVMRTGMVRKIHGGVVADTPPISPDSIAGLEMWLKADGIASLADGDPVTTWEDSHTSNKDATQATAAAKPTYQTNELNGLPGVLFDGVDDFMGVAGIQPNDATRTWFVVCELTFSNLAVHGVFGWWSDKQFAASNANQWTWNTNQAAGNQSIGTKVNATPTLLTLRFNSTASADGYVNGGSATNFDPSDGYQSGSDTLGVGAGRFNGSDPWYGYIYEILLYNSALSDSDREEVRRYLNSKWAVY